MVADVRGVLEALVLVKPLELKRRLEVVLENTLDEGLEDVYFKDLVLGETEVKGMVDDI